MNPLNGTDTHLLSQINPVLKSEMTCARVSCTVIISKFKKKLTFHKSNRGEQQIPSQRRTFKTNSWIFTELLVAIIAFVLHSCGKTL